ncbi:TIGR01459 family HAD-type hydrolase [Candidatus Paracaedibacter symbiosus]|uniref:TIGR01459 family HAD-type hydrolase n=1 Tax=Candidatus Paracaedibacter symbiosus TaxID=244582 RepID=UPI000509B0CD|nr:TIGR01459 family HAD-type hydrolase [Candidatus Paracaedibacter symbiosus]
MDVDISLLDWAAIMARYDTFLVDLVGVVYNGIDAFPEAIAALNQFPQNKNLIFVSNNPRPSELSLKKLQSFKVKPSFTVVTSGDFTKHNLDLDQEATYYHWGTERNTDILKGIDIKITDTLPQADKVLLTAFIEAEEDESQFDALIDQILARKLPVFCANPDRFAFYGKEIRKCAGYFADKLIAKGGEVTMWGKPNKSLYDFVGTKFPEATVDKKRCLMIGDTLETDILGAQHYGIDSLLVLSGITGALRQKKMLFSHAPLADIHPTYIWNHLGSAEPIYVQ